MPLNHRAESRLQPLGVQRADEVKGGRNALYRRFRSVVMEKPHPLLAVRGRINRCARMLLDAQWSGPGNGVRFAGGCRVGAISFQPVAQQCQLFGVQSRQPLLQCEGVRIRNGVHFTHVLRWLRFCSKTSLHIFEVAASSSCRAIHPPPATAATFAQPAAALDCLVHRKYLVWRFARAIEWLTKNQDATRLDPHSH